MPLDQIRLYRVLAGEGGAMVRDAHSFGPPPQGVGVSRATIGTRQASHRVNPDRRQRVTG
jgi:hypothetical protein